MATGRAERSRWYGTARWQKMRARQLAAEPLCRMCRERGHITVATVCDHVEHRDDNSTFWTGPFQSLCAPCHDSTKQSAEKRGYGNGSDASGMPVDPAHPWNAR